MPIIDEDNNNVSSLFEEFDESLFKFDHSAYLYEMRNYRALFDMWTGIALVIKFLTALLSIGACFILIYTIVRFPKLKSYNNIYLLHYCCWNCVELVVVPIFEILLQWILQYNIPFAIVCNIYQFVTLNILASDIFITFYLFDWYLINIDSVLTRNYQLYQKIVLIVCYIGLIIDLSWSTYGCFTFNLNVEFIPVLYVILFIFNIVIGILIKRRKLNEEQTTPFKITISVFLCWLPILSTFLLVEIFEHTIFSTHEVFFVLQALYHVFEIPKYLSPTIVVYLFYGNNRDFRKCYNTLARRFTNNKGNDDGGGDDKENETGFENLQSDRIAIL